MLRGAIGSVLAGLALLWASAAHASGDFGCVPAWKLVHRNLTGCDNSAVLGPGNDTRVNLLLLTFDRHGTPKDGKPGSPAASDDWATWRERFFGAPGEAAGGFAEGEGSRCRTDVEGARAFEAALAAAPAVPADERAALISARRGLKPTCAQANAGAAGVAGAVAKARSPAGAAFARYLAGAAAFYEGRYDPAAAAFTSLAAAPSPWLQDTGAYMRARVEVNRLQLGAFDEYGVLKPEKVDRRIADAATAALDGYLRARPRGAYAGSARGLKRRVDWLAGRTDRLAAAYAALLAQAPGPRGLGDAELAEEVDNKLLPALTPAATRDPLLLAVYDLQHMRTPDKAADKDCCGPALTLVELEGQRPAFASAPALFEHLLAVHAFYVERAPAKVLQLIPDATKASGRGYLAFSRQALRGMALEAVGDRNAAGFWAELLPSATPPYARPAAELGLAWRRERAGALPLVFDPASPIRNPAIREILLTHAADAELLRRQAGAASAPMHERETALFTLLYKEITRGRYADFVADAARIPPGSPAKSDAGYTPSLESRPVVGVFTQATASSGYPCPPLPQTGAALARAPKDAKARLCLAEFVRVYGFDGFALDTPPPADELGGAPSRFPGPVYSRLDQYRAVMSDAGAGPTEKAFALFRAVNCFAPSGNNACGGAEATKSQRKGWHDRLKAEFPGSRWASELKYWW